MAGPPITGGPATANGGEVVASGNFRYSAGYVECVRDTAAQEFLVAVGLPTTHVVFVACEAPEDHALLRVADRELLRIGVATESDDVGAYHVECGTGEVVYVDALASSELYVNASPELFADCLRLFESKIDDAMNGSDDPDPEQLADLLEAEISRIDSSALADDSGFWRSLLDDVAIGDYTEDEGEG
ncbi:SUKH-4 family immunity protein [Micromonospora sp. DT31]|uniref:SUKH-4 family immunity protein n=1 Tax=Micromonospora sp. DT31 TaxID=3393434 RepID=UPI003CF177CD